MAFAVTCKSCQARFLLNDDLLRRKVAGRIVTVRCRQCHAPIEVDASQVDTEPVTPVPARPEPPGPPPPPPLKAALQYKPAPTPPRPAKSSTLIGIGAPKAARPGEMVALSPGLLNMSAAAAPGPRGFPEPPPPPSALEELAGDWEIPEAKTPLMPAVESVESAPESVDDFIEELPPSLPQPPEEEPPSSVGTPALSALTQHGSAPEPRSDDFFSSAPLNLGAPTIDVSMLAGPSIDLSSLDVRRSGKQTLPQFGASDVPAPPSPAAELPAAAPPSLQRASASPASAPVPVPPPSQRPDSVRARRNVVAPTADSDPPRLLGQRRSVLAVPVLLALAAAAGFLIWKRGRGPVDTTPRSEATTIAQTSASPVVAPEPGPTAPVAVAAATTTLPPVDDVTFETTSAPPAGKAAPKAPGVTVQPPPERPSAPPAAPTAPAPSEPASPAPKPEAPPAAPSEPVGPFDRSAAADALTAAASAASTCRKEGDPSGTASVVITFAPSGRVTSANIGGPPFAGTPTGGCIAAALRKARVPPFDGERVTVSKTIVVQ